MKKLSYIILSFAILSCGNASSKKEGSIENKKEAFNNNSNETVEETSEINKDEVMPANEVKAEKNVKPKVITPKVINGKDDNEIRVVNDDDLEEPPAPQMPKIDFSKVYSQILSNYVSSSGKVDYASIKTNKEMLGQAITHYQENTPKSSWSSNQKLAYWINAYNLFTIKLIIDNYPVSSIKNIAGGKPWDKKFIQLDGNNYSLNDIENGIIRKQFNEPRIHFAVNCASISCPKLLNQEYTASNLNALLEKQAKRYINDKNENTFTSNSASISNIFDWYKGDFDGGVIPFLNKYLDNPLPANAKITYQDYNWNLNN